MSQKKVRAKHIMIDSANRRVSAVYPVRTSLSTLKLIATGFAAKTGLQARARTARLDNRDRMPVITLELRDVSNVETALKAFKEVTNPELSVAIELLLIELWICRCNFLSTRLADIRFVIGFEPEDAEAFLLRYYAAIQQIPMASLLKRDRRRSFAQLAETIEATLAKIGGYATQLEVKTRLDPRPCTHSE